LEDGQAAVPTHKPSKLIQFGDALDAPPHSIENEQPLQDVWVEAVRGVMEEGWIRLVKLERLMAPGGKLWSGVDEVRYNGTVHPMAVELFYKLQLYHRHYEVIQTLLRKGDVNVENDSSDEEEDFMATTAEYRESGGPTEWNGLVQGLLNALEHRLHAAAKQVSDVGKKSLFLMNCYEHLVTAMSNSFVGEAEEGDLMSYLCREPGWERKGFDLLHEKIAYYAAEQNRHRDVFVYTLLKPLLNPLAKNLEKPPQNSGTQIGQIDIEFENFGDGIEKLVSDSVRSARKMRIPNLDLQTEIRSHMIKTILKVYVAFHQKNSSSVSRGVAVLAPDELGRMLKNNLFPPEEYEKAQWRAGNGEYGLQALRDLGNDALSAVGVGVGLRAIVIEDDHDAHMEEMRGSTVHY